jgi:hypothetical protein
VAAEDDVTHRFLRLQRSFRVLSVPALPASLALLGALTGLTALVGCGGSQTNSDDALLAQVNGKAPVELGATKDGDSSAGSGSGSSDKSAKEEDLNEAQKTQMEIALRRGGDKSANCASVVPDSAKGEGEVKVTFDGKKGRAVDVAVGAPWAGTDAEQCIKRAFIGEIIVPFEGQLEVPYTVKLGPKGGDAADKGKGGKTKKK